MDTIIDADAAKKVVTDDRFTLLKPFSLTVPKEYDHSSQLTSFAKANRQGFVYYNSDITDSNFVRASQRLVPGKTYSVKIFQINKTVSSKDCLGFLRKHKAILVGAQGISLVWEQVKDKFLVSRWIVSFDKKDALWKDPNGDHRVPFVYRCSDGDWEFGLGGFKYNWRDDHCLLYVCD